MTTILIAADESEESVNAARVAHLLFGDDAEYLVINVGSSIPNDVMAWGYAYPVAMPMLAYPPQLAERAPGEPTPVEEAEDRASAIAAAAAIEGAEAVGDVGDPSEAILVAARDQGADVIVVGSHERSWFSRLLTGSVSHDVVRRSEIPVLVVK
ncbi:MAG: universal stress protein [Acidimicrobiia bacterium]